MKPLNRKMHRPFIATRLVLCVILGIMAVAGFAQPAQASGLYTHTWFVERAIQRLEAIGGYSELIGILNSYPGIVNYGATFPDVPYASDPDWSESVHDSNGVGNNYSEYLQFLSDHGYNRINSDLQVTYYQEFFHDPNYTTATPPFRTALMGQILESFRNNPRSQDDQKKIAFLFGLIAHQEADTPWHWMLPDCNDPTWNGLECMVKNLPGVNEVTLDWVLHYYDSNNTSNNAYYFNIRSTILAASDAGGFPRPICSRFCVPPFDPLDFGETAVEGLWVTATSVSLENAAMRDFLVDYSPGGIEYGSALIAVSWMETWDAMSHTNRYYVKPASSGSANCSNWENACSMQFALAHAVNGEIWAAAGIYKPTEDTTDRIASFRLRTGVAVYGGFAGMETARYQRNPAANPSILSGDIDHNDADPDGDHIIGNADEIRGSNSFHVVIGVTGATLDGFVVTAGDANEGNTCPSRGCGGGMENIEANVLISNVTFSGNRAVFGGGGMGNSNWIGSGSSGAIPSPRIMNVTFSGNKAAVGGGMLVYNSQPRITNVTFSNNSAVDHGGGMTIITDAMDISHATFYGNIAGQDGGGAYVSPGGPGSIEFRNSIFWENTSPTGRQVSTWMMQPSIVASVVQGGCPPISICTDVTGLDPMLGTLGDYGGSTPTIPLLAGSSAINMAGAKACETGIEMSGAGGLDQRGVHRPQGLGCDMGAYEVDDIVPSLTSFTRHDPATSPTNFDQLTFRATFSDNMHDVDPSDFIVTGTTATITDITAISNSVYDITVSGGDLPDLDGTVGLNLATGQDIADMAENALPPGEPSIDETYLVSNAELYLDSFTRQSPASSSTNADVLVIRATFSAVAQYLDRTAFNVTGSTASVTVVTPVDPFTFDITIAGGDLAGLNGMVGLDLSPRSEIADLNQNPMPLVEPAIDETYLVDNALPSLISFSRQNPPASLTNASALVFRVTFNEAVRNMNGVDFTVSGTTATVSNVSLVSAGVYDLTISGGDLTTYNGMVNLNLAVRQDIQDLAGNGLPAGEPAIDQTYMVDHITPTRNSFRRWLPHEDPTNDDTLVFEANFSEAIMNIDAACFTVTGTTASVIGAVMISPGSYLLTVSGGDLAGLTGTVGLDLAPGQDITDLAGNPLPMSEPPIDETFSLDNTAPVLISITRLNPAGSPTNADVLIFRATFSKSVRNVDTGSFVVTGSTATVTLVAGSFLGTIYDLTVSGGDLTGLNGIVGLDLASGQIITDLVGNALPTAEPGTDETYVIDNIAPSMISILRQVPIDSPTNAASVTFRVNFGEVVQNVNPDDFGLTFTGTVTGGINAVNPISASIYDIVINGVGGDGTIILNFSPANDISDPGGNPIGAIPTIGIDETYVIDNTFPTVIYGLYTFPVHNGAMDIGPTQISIAFSEDVLQDRSIEAANSLSNYLLVEAGENYRFDTMSCAGGRVSDDLPIFINRISVTNNVGTVPSITTLYVNHGVPLQSGSYRLYICGTTSIHDLAGNHINGGMSDSHLNFTVIEILPNTGFAPNRITRLPDQPAEKIYTSLSDLWLEIPRLGTQIPIVGVPLSTGGSWDVSWLGQNAGWLNGSAFPTSPGNSVLTGHVYDSYGTPGPFVQMNQLRYGDQIIVHLGGHQYIYEVREVLQVGPDAASAMLKHQEQSWITLVTCRGYDEPTSSYKYRMLVRALLVKVK